MLIQDTSVCGKAKQFPAYWTVSLYRCSLDYSPNFVMIYTELSYKNAMPCLKTGNQPVLMIQSHTKSARKTLVRNLKDFK